MDISNARANVGLSAAAEPTGSGVAGQVTIGSASTQLSLTGCDVAYSVRAVIAATGAFVIDTVDNDTAASDAFALGTAQVETATAAGTITLAGNATVTVTAAGMTGSPKTISVAVANTDTAATWAGKVRTALAADTDVSALFTTGGATTTINLTRKASTLGLFPANDATLNIALDNGTCTGITPAASSANTTAGVASTGTLISDGDGKDFEGVTIPVIATLKAISIKCTTGEVDLTSAGETATLTAGENRVLANNAGIPSMLAALTFTAVSNSDITITVVGATA